MNRRDFLKTTLAATALGAIAGRADYAGEKTITDVGGGKMTNRTFAGKEISLLGMGLMRLPVLPNGKINYSEGEKMIARARAAGINYFDTAYMYHGGESEKFVGAVLAKYPRDSYYLASKMPVWMANDAADMERIFNEQLQRCRTPYFDFYLIHALDKNKWELAQRYRAYEFLQKKKAEGKIRHLGFSFHDRPEELQKIVNAHKWEFAQIQLNYLDWEQYRSREQYEILEKARIPVIVMEPVRGGSLAQLPPDAEKILAGRKAGVSTASWALRFAASLPGVLTVLSGMSTLDQVEDNIRTFSPLVPLADADREALTQAMLVYRKALAVPCTSCRYCQPCPMGVAIPRIFMQYNQYKITGDERAFHKGYSRMPKGTRAEDCVNCGKCVKVCPQHIDIPAEMAKIAQQAAQIAKKMA